MFSVHFHIFRFTKFQGSIYVKVTSSSTAKKKSSYRDGHSELSEATTLKTFQFLFTWFFAKIHWLNLPKKVL